LVLDKKS